MFFPKGVNMDQTVLGFRKMMFDLVMDPGGNGMSLAKGQVSIAGDLHIHKIPGTKLACFDIVQGQHTVLLEHQLLQLGKGLFVNGAVQHFAQGIQQDLNGGTKDEDTDDQRSDGIQAGKPSRAPATPMKTPQEEKTSER